MSDSTDLSTTQGQSRNIRQRDLTFAGVIVLLISCLTAGVICSAGFHFVQDATTSGWHWKGDSSTKTAIDLSPGDKTDQEESFVFKKVDLVELDDSIHMMNATEAMLKMDYGKSLAELKQMSPARFKSDSGCTTLEVECLLSLKQSEKVIAIANETVRKTPQDYAGWLWRGEAYEQLKQYDKAIADYKKALSMFPNTRKELEKSMSTALIDQIEQAIAGMVYRRMGASHERAGDYKQAALDYERAVIIQMPNLPSTLQPKIDRVAVSTAQKNVQELTGAIASRPDDDGLYLMRAKAYKVLGKYDLAIRDYDKVGKREAANLFYERAGARFAMGDYKNAAHDLRKVHAEDPLYEMPHMRQKKYSLAVMPLTTMKKSRVLSRFDKLIQDNPSVDENYFHRGVLQMAFREYDEGANDFQQFIQMKGDTRSVVLSKAYMYTALCRGLSRRKNEYDASLAKASSACDSKWWHSIISYLGDRGVTEKMLLDASQDNKARSVQAHYYIGQYLAVKGLKTKAAEHFQKGIAIGAPVDEYYLCKLALLPDTRQGMGAE